MENTGFGLRQKEHKRRDEGRRRELGMANVVVV